MSFDLAYCSGHANFLHFSSFLCHMKSRRRVKQKTKEEDVAETAGSVLNQVLRYYDSRNLPDEPANVTFQLSLQNIIGFDKENSILTVNAWLFIVSYIRIYYIHTYIQRPESI